MFETKNSDLTLTSMPLMSGGENRTSVESTKFKYIQLDQTNKFIRNMPAYYVTIAN